MKPKTMPSGIDANLVVGVEDNGAGCYLVLCDSEENIISSSCTSTMTKEKIYYTTTYSCPNDGKNYTLKNNTCYEITSRTKYYSCSSGTLEGTNCKVTEEKNYGLTCSSGYKYNSKCNVCEKE